MKKLEMKQMELVVGGQSDSECAWAAAKAVVLGGVGAGVVLATGGSGLALLAVGANYIFNLRETLKKCNLL